MRTRSNQTESLAENQTSKLSENANIKDKDIWMQHDKLVSKSRLAKFTFMSSLIEERWGFLIKYIYIYIYILYRTLLF